MFGDHIMKLNVKNILNFLQLDNHVDKRGYLYKKGEVNKGWQRRWFLLKGNMLFYFQNPHDVEPVGLIILEGCTINSCSTDNTTFSISFQADSSRTYHLSADDEESCSSWINSLQRSSYGYLSTQVQRLQDQVLNLEKKKNMYLGRRYTTTAGPGDDGDEDEIASSSQRSASLHTADGFPHPGSRSPKPKHGLRAFSSPFAQRKKFYHAENKRNAASPSRARKTKENTSVKICRTFQQLHQDFAPGQPVILDGPTVMYKYQALNVEGFKAPGKGKKAAWYVEPSPSV